MRPSLLIVALDAADPDALLGWARDGYLPTIASLIGRGTHAYLRGPEMISVHAVWTSFWSGVSLAQHGFFHQRSLRPGTYQLHWRDVPDGEAPAFWSSLAGSGRRVVTVDVLGVGAVPQLRGGQVVGWGDHPTSAAPVTSPPELLDENTRVAGARVFSDERAGNPDRDRRILQQLLDRVERKGQLARHLIARDGGCDLAVVSFGDAHAAGHRFRGYRDERSPPTLTTATREVYQAIDREIGNLRDAFASPPNVFVVSNSGIEDGLPMGGVLEDFLRQLRYVTHQPHATSVVERLAAFARRTIPHRWSGSPASRFGRGVDWTRTTAFAIPSQYTGYLRINLRGREPHGTVAAGAEYEDVLTRLCGDLWQLVDDDSGEPVVQSLTRTAEVFGGGPPTRLPDLFVEWRPARTSSRIRHPRATIRQDKLGDPRGNHHSDVGVVIGAGPDIDHHGPAGDLSPTDFAPLFQALLRARPGSDVAPTPAVGAFLGH
jgi:predicted AlkP superfamily phosphohydrolase/phosphomutase